MQQWSHCGGEIRLSNAEPDAKCPWCQLEMHPFRLVEHQLIHIIPGYRDSGNYGTDALLRQSEKRASE